jgi:DoxX-like protein
VSHLIHATHCVDFLVRGSTTCQNRLPQAIRADEEVGMTRGTFRKAAFWTTTVFGPSSFVIGGVIGLIQADESVLALRHLGYPTYFGPLLGLWKLLGAIVITVPGLPRLKEWAYAGFVFDLTAAALSHAAVGDAAVDIVSPLVFLLLVLASWALRPASRRPGAPAVRQPVGATEEVGGLTLKVA